MFFNDSFNLFNVGVDKGACDLTRWAIILYALLPSESWSLNTSKPSLVLPPLIKISDIASVQIDSEINGDVISLPASNIPFKKSSIIPSSSSLPEATALVIVWKGLIKMSYGLAWLKSIYLSNLPVSLSLTGSNVEFLDQSATNLLNASISSWDTLCIVLNAATVAAGIAAVVAAIPTNLW